MPIRLDEFDAPQAAQPEAQAPKGPIRLDDFEAGKKSIYLKDENTIVEAPPETKDEDLLGFIQKEVYGKKGGGLLGTVADMMVGPAAGAARVALSEPVKKAGWNALKGAGSFFGSLPGIAGSLLQEEGERMAEGPTLKEYFGAGAHSLFDPNLSAIDRVLLTTKADPLLSGVTNAVIASRVLKRELADRTQIDERMTALGQEIQSSNREWMDKNEFKPDPEFATFFDLGAAGATVLTSLGIGYATRNPGLVAGLFGAIQKGQLYQEARATGKSPEAAGNLSTLGGIAEGALEGLGLEIFMNTLRGSKTAARILLRSGEEAIQEALQQTAEETVAKLGWDREGSLQDIAKRIGYSAMIGFVVGAPAAVTATALENRGIIGELRRAGMNDKEAKEFMTIITEKIIADAAEGVVNEIRFEVNPEYRADVMAQDKENQGEQDVIDAAAPVQEFKPTDEADQVEEVLKSYRQAETLEELQKTTPEAKTVFDSAQVLADRNHVDTRAQTMTIDTTEREELRQRLADQIYNKNIQTRKRDKVAFIVMGGPGAGKGQVTKQIAEQFGAVDIDNDIAKAMLPEYGEAGKGAGVVHDEATYIAERLVLEKALANGDNISLIKVGKTEATIRSFIQLFKAHGYKVNLVQVDLNPEKAAARVLKRHYYDKRQGFVDPNYVLNIVGLKPGQVYDTLRSEVDEYARYKNDVPFGTPAELVETSQGWMGLFGRGQGNIQRTDGALDAKENAGNQVTPESPAPKKAGESPAEDSSIPEGTEETLSKDDAQFLSDIAFESENQAETDFIFGAPAEEVASELSQEEAAQAREIQSAEDEVVSFMAKKEFIDLVGKFRRNKDGFLKEELSTISRMFFTSNEKAETIDEVADRLGMSSDVLIGRLQDISRTWKSDLARYRDAQRTLVNYYREDMARRRSLNQKVQELKKHLRTSKALNYKAIIRKMTGQAKTQNFVSEMQALRANMQAQVRAALAAEKSTKQDLRDLKRGLVDLIKNMVAPAGQRRFLGIIADAQSGAAILKAVNRIEKVTEELHRKELVAAIKKTLDKIETTKAVAVDYVQKVRDLVNGLDLTRRTADTMKRLLEIRQFIDKKAAAGEEVTMPRAILEKLEILSAQPLNQIKTQTLENILRDMAILIDAGKKKLERFEQIQELKKQNALATLSKSKKLDEKDIIKAKPGERLTREQVMKNQAARIMNWAMRLDLSITPMDVIFDQLDGVVGYQGGNFRIFKKTVDDAFSRYIVKKDEVSRDIVELAEDLKLDDADFEKIGFYAAAQQEGGAKKLESVGFTQKEIEAVTLNAPQMKLYTLMREKLDALRPEIAEVMRTVYNEEMGQVKNYFPFMTDFEAMTDAEIRERFGNNVEEFGQAPRKNVQKGFTKKRVGGKQRIKLNAMEIFLGHIDNAAYLVTVGKEVKLLGEIAADPKYAEAVGELGQEVVRDWVDIVARKGRAQGQRDNLLDVFRRHTGAATLGFKLSSTLIQPTALFDGAALIGGKAFEGATLIAQKEWREFILANMPEVRARIGDDIAFTEFGKKTAIDKVRNAGFWALQRLDALTASSVAAGAYVKFIEEKGGKVDLSKPDPEAISYAQKIVRRTQASSFFKDAPSALTRGTLTGNKSVDRAILQFQTFMLNRWSLIKHDMVKAGIVGENKAQAVNIATWLTLAAFAETGIRRVTKEFLNWMLGDDDDKEEDGFFEDVAKNLLSSIPFVSSVISFSQYGTIPIPFVSMMQRIGKRAEAVARSKKKKTLARNRARFAITLIGWLLGVPGTVQADDVTRKSMR